MPYSCTNLIRRILNRLIGHGPWRVAPFAKIAEDLTSHRPFGVHRPEQFTGLVYREAGEAQYYPPAHNLLSQSPAWETIEGQPRYRERGLTRAEPKLLFSLCHAGIIGNEGIVYCPHSRRAVEETVRCWVRSSDTHPVLGALRYPAAQTLTGLSLSLASLDSGGFYHFFHETLPRLWLARDFLPRVEHILVSGARDSLREAWLKLANVPVEKIIWLHGLAHHRCEQLLFSNLPLLDYQPTSWNIRAIRSLFCVEPAGGSRWLWISRSDAQKRHLQWEDELLRRFPRFEKIVLSRLAPAEQLRLFTSAAVVAGPHGAGFSHLANCPTGGRFIELFPLGYRQPIYARLAQVARLTSAWAMVDFTRPAAIEPLTEAMRNFLAEQR